jgi:Mn2+/Fe2+ NRAMP family transporter
MSDLPDGISQARSVDLSGRSQGPWVRRVLLGAIAVLPVLALLGVFGQTPTTTTTATAAATMSVTAPSRLRSGLIFQARVEVVAHRDISQVELSFDRGWWESMSVNSIEPNPSNESSENGRVVLSYGPLPAGRTLVSWIYFQVNPTNHGARREDVALADGSNQLLQVHRAITIFP